MSKEGCGRGNGVDGNQKDGGVVEEMRGGLWREIIWRVAGWNELTESYQVTSPSPLCALCVISSNSSPP